MDSYRLFVGLVFAVSVFLLVDAWVRDRPHAETAPATPTGQALRQTPSPSLETPVPPSAQQGSPAAASGALQGGTATLPKGERIRVQTDFLIAEIDTHGGDLRHVEFLAHKERGDKDKNFVLLEEDPPRVYVARSGLIQGEGLADHNTVFSAEKTSFELAPNEDVLVVRLEAATPSAKVVKTYTFHRGSYVVDVGFEVTNLSSTPAEPYAYFQLVRDTNPPEGDSRLVPTYTGAEVYTEKDKLHKVSFADIEANKGTYPKSATDGWLAFVQHYFLSAWVLPQGTPRDYFLKPLTTGLVAGGVITPVGKIEPKQTAKVDAKLYAGPQEQERLKALAPGLELTIDYGWLRVLAVPLFWVLNRDPFRGRKLGRCDHHSDGIDQAGVLPALGDELQVDGADEGAGAQAAAPEGTVRRRSPEDAPGDDRVVQDREDQSAGWLPADRRPDPGLYRAVLGAAAERGVAARTFYSMDQ